MNNQRKITKAVIPVAGLGTRFLPATKVVPKELLPIVDKPALQYVIEEAVNAGLTDIILVTNPLKSLIEEHFTTGTAYDELLRERGKHYLLRDLHELNEKINIRTVYQERPLGLGHAVLCAKEAVGEEWFVVLLPDMLIDAEPSCTEHLINIWHDVNKTVIAVEKAPREELSQYGVVAIDSMWGHKNAVHWNGLHKVTKLVEKPKVEEAPSDLIVAGRYLLPPAIFDYLEKTCPSCGGEIQITDSLSSLAGDDGMYSCEVMGAVHDIGDKLGYIKANIHYAMKQPEYSQALRCFLEKI